MRRATPRWTVRTGACAFLLLASFVADAGEGTPPAPVSADAQQTPAIRREIRVRIACDEEWRTGLDWEATARLRLRQASALFERRFGIRWVPVDVVTWTSDDAAGSLGVLLDALQREVARTDVDVVLGFVGQSRAKGADRDYSLAGQARLFGPAAIFRRTSYRTAEAWVAGALAHELGHLLGAWHCDTPASIMFHSGDRTSYFEFDEQSAAAIELSRDLDFSRGVDWLDEPRRSRIREIYRSGHAPDALVPYAAAEIERASVMCSLGHMRDARAAYRKALAEQEACVAPDDYSLTLCLRCAAWAELRSFGKDLEQAEILAQRGHDIAAAAHRPEQPPLACDLLLADIEWERGRRDLAELHYRQIYEERLNKLGAADPDTVEVKRVLERRNSVPVRRRESDIAWDLPTSSVADRAFENPKSGTLHVRASREPAPDTTRDWSYLRFEVATPEAGRLTLSLRQGGPAPEPPRVVTTHVAGGCDADHPTVVAFSFRSVDRTPTEPTQKYVCTLCVKSVQEETASFSCAVPVDGSVGIRRKLRLAGAVFARMPVSASQLFARQWIAAGEGVATKVLRDSGGELVAVDGTTVSADGAGAKQLWSLELSFVPDPVK